MKRATKSADEDDVAGRGRRYYTYLQRAGVASAIKRRMRRRERRAGKPARPAPPATCRPYYCPTVDDYECCGYHCGFDVCCSAPELHWPLTQAERYLLRILGEPIPGE
ncbi:hypothetical protein [Micromonospora sp. NPDC047730]|uniref:hypothetical protein n=1 Tax=Micromonospora sp. NPDC047730 TaxID=3364253 RepID=UPI0037197CCC